MTEPPPSENDRAPFPRLFAPFAESAMAAFRASDPSRVRAVDLGCGGGELLLRLAARFPGARFEGVDPSEEAIDRARARAGAQVLGQGGGGVAFVTGDPFEAPLEPASYSHVVAAFVGAAKGDRPRLFAELGRLVAPGGVAIATLPLFGSFLEIVDLLREYSLKHAAPELDRLAAAGASGLPSTEALDDELRDAGFRAVIVTESRATIRYEGGRDLLADPFMRGRVFPALQLNAQEDPLSPALLYLRDAIDTYFSESSFELTVAVGRVVATR